MPTNLNDLLLSRRGEEGAVLELKHPGTGEATGWKLKLKSADAASIEKLKLEQRRKRMEQLSAQGHDRIDPRTFDEESIELMVEATLGWEGITVDGGVEYTFSAANARVLYQEQWIREQVAAFMSKRANFLPRSASGS